jgi:AraC-like DNA-binding protein
MSPSLALPIEHPPTVLAIGVGRHREESHRYRLHGLWCVHLYRYRGELVLPTRRYPIRPGTASFVPPDTPFEHVWPEWPAVHMSVHFRANGQTTVDVPVMQPVADDFERLYADLLEATRWLDREPERLQARVWDVLWRLARGSEALVPRERTHPALARAEAHVRANLGTPLSIASLAEEVGVSHNHLIRLFRATHGSTVQQYVRRQRAERARHLLVHTTLPIKAIAREVGLGTLQQLNKTLRAEFGAAPRELRHSDPTEAEGTGFVSKLGTY